MATVRISARGASDAASGSAPSRTTEMRLAFSVSCASGVMWPPATSTIVLPYSSTRASASVTI